MYLGGAVTIFQRGYCITKTPHSPPVKKGVKTRRGRAVGQSFSTKVEYNFGYMWGFYFLQQEHNEILVGIYHVHNYGIMVVKEAKRLSK